MSCPCDIFEVDGRPNFVSPHARGTYIFFGDSRNTRNFGGGIGEFGIYGDTVSSFLMEASESSVDEESRHVLGMEYP
jgi:hypothetical protein